MTNLEMKITVEGAEKACAALEAVAIAADKAREAIGRLTRLGVTVNVHYTMTGTAAEGIRRSTDAAIRGALRSVNGR